MDPISRIAKDTGVPREVLVRVVGATVKEHRVLINDDDEPEEQPVRCEDLVSIIEAGRRTGVNHATIRGWVWEGLVKSYTAAGAELQKEDRRQGAARFVTIADVERVAASLPRRPGPRGPRKQKPEPAYTQELAAAGQ